MTVKASGIQSWASVLVGGAVVAFLAWLSWHQAGVPRGPRARAGADADASLLVDASTLSPAASNATSEEAGAATPLPAMDGGLSLSSSLFGDGGAIPSTAPRTVKLGVVLVQFVGAEGAPSSARSKADAQKHALGIAEAAREDWKAAVKGGDPGSAEDIGRIPRGVLEHATEVVVFSLAKGDVSEPLETPRGYWIVKRLE